MAKVPIKRQDLEAIALEKLRRMPHCEGATNVSVHLSLTRPFQQTGRLRTSIPVHLE
jgi:hypothetical protein